MSRPKKHICNKCGKSCIPELAKKQGFDEPYGLKAKFSSGYFSEVFPDGNEYRFKVCEACIKEFMDTFLIPVKVKEYM